jgi:cytochrome P450
MSWWMLAMVTHPEVQKRAQAEIDAVVGRDRVPTFSDMADLPYIRAMVKEALRWRPVDPFGLPHHTIEDDWYKGMFIPKNSIIIANVWELNHNPELHGNNVMAFDPSRFIDKDGNVTSEEGHGTYGFGRRVCVGRHVADQALFINMATLLWGMNIEAGEGLIDVEDCIEEGLVV